MTDRIPHIFPELESPVDLIVHTRSPEKWILVDRETGKIFQGSPSGRWDRLMTKEDPEQSPELS